jgi:hypothetical protein
MPGGYEEVAAHAQGAGPGHAAPAEEPFAISGTLASRGHEIRVVSRNERVVRGSGAIIAVIYASMILWAYARQPQTIAQVTGGLGATIGVYHVDPQSYADGLQFFKRDQFVEARAAFARADAAERDSTTQFYIAYSYYREGWGRLYSDDALFAKGLESVNKAIALAPGGRLVVEDPDLRIHSADELKAELQRGLERDVSDLNPMRLFRTRK